MSVATVAIIIAAAIVVIWLLVGVCAAIILGRLSGSFSWFIVLAWPLLLWLFWGWRHTN